MGFLPEANDRGATVKLHLMITKLACQMRSSFGQMVSAFRDAPNHRQPSLRTGQSLLRRSIAGVVGLLKPAMSFGQLPGCFADAFHPMRPVNQPRRDPIAIEILVLVCAGVVHHVDSFGFGDHRRCLLGEPCLATVGVDRGVGGDLRAVDRDRAEPCQPGTASDHQHLAEQISEHVLVPRTEPRDRRVIGNVLRAQDTKRDVRVTQPLDLTRGPHPVAVRVDQQTQQDPRVIPSSTGTTPTTTLELADVQDIDGIEDEPDQVIARQPVPHIHRQQHRLVTQHRTIRLGHAP
jgi:hypothetical protein